MFEQWELCISRRMHNHCVVCMCICNEDDRQVRKSELVGDGKSLCVVLDKLLLYSGIELVTQNGIKYAKYQLLGQLPSTKLITKLTKLRQNSKRSANIAFIFSCSHSHLILQTQKHCFCLPLLCLYTFLCLSSHIDINEYDTVSSTENK